MNILESINPGAIAQDTVHSKIIHDSGRKFIVRYFGADGELVVKRAAQAVEQIDKYRSPKRSMVFKLGEQWAVDVTYYGFD